MREPPPLPVTAEDVAERRRRVEELRAMVARGEYRVPADLVAEALLEQLRRDRRMPGR